ncbi:MAG: aldehyde dehydrogenase family protein [Oscillospiraceae bacterium]|jgi:succinate-semialdehyde dehydrogenase/glutarate-semialdehyde dehydrogenase|nr:aldehyde dehydrogenase family protein [Oscillospiraceae bacterium]
MQMIINGKPADASDGAVIEVINPADGSVIDTVPAAAQEDVNRAVEAAKAGQKIWAEVPVYKRGEILFKFVDLVEENKERLARTLSQETGKPITEARGEIANIPISFHGFVEKAKHLYGDVIPNGLEKNQERHMLITVREPIGVVACVIPFNFPCDLFDQKVAPTLLAGNAAIVKPSTDNPLTLCMLTKLLVEAGVPDGAIQILTGRGSQVGTWLCSHPDVHAITLTGSTEVGIETYRNAAGHLAHIALELGGNDAFILHEDGDVDLAVEEMIWGRMYNTGQVCCASKRFLVHNSLKDEFTEKAIARIKKIKLGNPADDETQLGCLISEKAALTVEKQVNLTVEQGGRIVLGGKRSGAFYEPTVIADVPKSAEVAKDMEIFGPVVPIIGFDTLDEAIEIANASIFGLCGCIFTSDIKTAYQTAAKLECGGVIINGASFFRSFEMPFGGYKFSGIGTEGVLSTFDEVTRLKTIVLKNIFAK